MHWIKGSGTPLRRTDVFPEARRECTMALHRTPNPRAARTSSIAPPPHVMEEFCGEEGVVGDATTFDEAGLQGETKSVMWCCIRMVIIFEAIFGAQF